MHLLPDFQFTSVEVNGNSIHQDLQDYLFHISIMTHSSKLKQQLQVIQIFLTLEKYHIQV